MGAVAGGPRTRLMSGLAQGRRDGPEKRGSPWLRESHRPGRSRDRGDADVEGRRITAETSPGTAKPGSMIGFCAPYTMLTRRLMLDDSSLTVVLAQQAAALVFAITLERSSS
jgi:hypothetical protein